LRALLLLIAYFEKTRNSQQYCLEKRKECCSMQRSSRRFDKKSMNNRCVFLMQWGVAAGFPGDDAPFEA
jgi:hypothetical protein